MTLRHVLRPGCWSMPACWGRSVLAMLVSLLLRARLQGGRGARPRRHWPASVEAGRIENVYRLQIMNATESTPQRFRFAVDGLAGLANGGVRCELR